MTATLSRRSRVVAVLVQAPGALAGLAMLALAYVYAALSREYDAPLEPIAPMSALSDLEEGRRMAIIVGCWAGCHGMEGEGGTEEAAGIFRATSPTLSEVLPRYSDEELVRLIRFGVKRDGRTALGMISGTFYALSDADLARIITHLRRQPTLSPVPRERQVTFRGRLALVLGKWKNRSADATWE